MKTLPPYNSPGGPRSFLETSAVFAALEKQNQPDFISFGEQNPASLTYQVDFKDLDKILKCLIRGQLSLV